jgi:hypothetical protein
MRLDVASIRRKTIRRCDRLSAVFSRVAGGQV